MMQDIEKIDWSKVLLADELRKPVGFFKRLVTLLAGSVSFFFRRSVPDVDMEPGAILCIKSMERGDYEEQWALTLDCIRQTKQVVIIELGRGLSLDPFKRLRRLLPAWQASKHKNGIINRLSGALLALYCLDIVHSFRYTKPARVLFFAEMRPFENVLVQHFNSKSVPTATLQHGLFIDYGDKKTVNRLNYEASCAQIFLAWGEETSELILRFNPKAEIIICGALQISDKVEDREPACVYVVLDADINRKENEILLDIGKRVGEALSIELVACLHPRNQKEWYDLEAYSFPSESDAYTRKGLVLGHTTTQLLKLARLGKLVYKLKSAEPCNRRIPEEVCFSDAEELLSKMNTGNYPYDWSHAHIAHIDSSAVSKYSAFFSSWS